MSNIYSVMRMRSVLITMFALFFLQKLSAQAPASLSYGSNNIVFDVSNSNPVSFTPTSSGGAVTTYSISPTQLPNGVSFDPATGIISGQSGLSRGTVAYTVTGTNSSGSTSVSVNISVAGPVYPFNISGALLYENPRGNAALIQGQAATIVAAQFYPAATYTLDPSTPLPPGLSLNSSTGLISGTPTTPQDFGTDYYVTVTNVYNGVTTSQRGKVQIGVIRPSFNYSSTPNLYTVNGNAITPLTPNTSFAGLSLKYTSNTALPPGLTLNQTTGVISGTPTQATPNTPYVISVEVSSISAPNITNVGKTLVLTSSVSIDVQGPPASMAYNRSDIIALQNAPLYLVPLPYVSPAALRYQMNPSSPPLPAGLSLNTTTGEITGSPTALQSATTYSVDVINAYGTATATIKLEVATAPTVNYSPSTPAPYPVGTTISSLTPALTNLNLQANSAGYSGPGIPLINGVGRVSYIGFGGYNVLAETNSIQVYNGNGQAYITFAPEIFPTSYVVADQQSLFYSVNNGKYTVVKFDVPTGKMIANYGAGVSGYQDGPGTLAQFGTMGQIAPDAAGAFIYVPDRDNKRIRLINTRTNTVSTIAGTGATGTANGAALSATFTDPVAVALPGDGYLYIMDNQGPANSIIRRLDLNTNQVSDYYTTGVTSRNYLVSDKAGDLYMIYTEASQDLRRISTRTGVTSFPISSGGQNQPGLANIQLGPDDGRIYSADINTTPFLYINAHIFTPGESISISPALAPGLSFDPTTGIISGTPTGAGLTAANSTVTYTITATNRVGKFASNLTLSIVRPPSGLSYQYSPWDILVGSTAPADTRNDASLSVPGVPAATFSVSPTLPAGLSLNTQTGQISGQALNLSASQPYTVTAANAYGSVSSTLNISVKDKPRPAYVTPQVVFKGSAMSALTPTNTGGDVLSPAYERISTLATAGPNQRYWDMARDASGNFYVAVENTSTSTSSIIKLDPTAATLLNTWTFPSNSTLGYSAFAKARGLTIDGNTAYIAFNDNYDVYTLDISNPSAAPVLFQAAFCQDDIHNGTLNSVQVYNGKVYVTAEDFGMYVSTISPAASSNDFTTHKWGGAAVTENKFPNQDPAYDRLGMVRINASGTFMYGSPFVNRIRVGVYDPVNKILTSPQIYNISGTSGFDIDASGGGVFAPSQGSGTGSFGLMSGGSITPYGTIVTNSSQDGYIPTPSGGTAAGISANDMMRLLIDASGDLYFLEGGGGTGRIRKYERRVAYTIDPALPAGLQMDPQTGVISGTPTAVSPATNYTVKAYNSVGNRSTVVSLQVVYKPDFSYQYFYNSEPLDQPNVAGYVAVPRFGNNSSGTVFKSSGSSGVNLQITEPVSTGNYSSVFSNPNTTYSVSPALPGGLTLNTSTGAISGTPNTARNNTVYTVTAVSPYGSATAQLQFAITGPANLSYGNQTFVNGIATTANALYGGISGTASFAVTGGVLPTGVTLNPTTGVLSYDGVGAATSATPVVISVSGSISGLATTSLTITILGPGTGPSGLNYNGPISLVTGSATTTTPTITAGTAGSGGLTYTISPSIAAIAGLSFNTSTGVISGTPTTAVLATSFVITATSIYGSTSQVVTISVGTPPSALSYPSSSYQFWQGDPISNISSTVTNGTGSTNFSASGLPVGLSIDPLTGTIYGIPTVAQAATSATISATNAYGSVGYSISFTIVATPAISYASPYNFVKNQAIATVTPTTTGGISNAFSVSPAMPAGLSYNTSNGNITGTPTTDQLAVTYTATISSTVNSVTKSATGTFTITVGTPPSALSYTTPNVLGQNVRMTALAPTITTGSGTVTYSATGLPAGVLIDPNTGAIYGTPTATQSATAATVTATSGYGSTSTTVQFTVGAPPRNLAYAPAANVTTTGTSLSNTPTITAGTGVTTYSISPGLPSGLSFNTSTGAITGSSSSTTNNTYTVTASNSFGSTSAVVQINIGVAPAFSYPTPNVYPAGAAINTLSPTITAGTGASTYSVSPSLPAGLTLDPVFGNITGTPTVGVAVATAVYTVTATNAFGSSTAQFQLTVQGPPTNLSYGGNQVFSLNVATPTITPTVTASPAVTAYALSPALPVGLSFNAATGAITGTPTVTQAASTYTLSATNGIQPDATYTFTIAVTANPVISYVTPQNYAVGTAITALSPTVQNGTGSTYTISPALPAGLTMNASTGQISGTPTVVSAATAYTITATNGSGSGSTVLTIATGTAPSALGYVMPSNITVNTTISSVTPTVNGGTGTLTYSVSPSLPAGMSINPATGVISGTPTVATANTSYTVTVSNPFGSATTTFSFTVGVPPSALSYTTPNVFQAGTAITALNPTITSGSGSLTYAVSPALPSGLTLNTSTGVISGTPVAGVVSAATTYTVTATNSFGSTTASLSIQVQSAPTGLSYGNLVYTVNVPISAVLPTVVASPAPTYSISPALPAGLSFNTATGAITGTPTVTMPTTSFTVTANNGIAPNGTATFTILVGAPPVISYTTPQVYVAGTAIASLNPTVQNGATTWSVSPALPSGLTLNSATGVISGTPTTASVAAPYTVTAINSFGSGTAVVTLSVGIAPAGLSYTLPSSSFAVGTSVGTIVPTLPTGSGPVTYSVSPSLPAGLSINPATGVITGTPTSAVAAANYTITATNAYGSVSTTINFATGIAPSALSYNPTNSFTAGTAITALNPTITVGSGTPVYTISPSLPSGLSINAATGVISGTPVAGVSSPATTYTVTATTAFGSVTGQLSISVAGPPTGLSYGGNYVFVVNNAITPVVPTVNALPAPTGYTISPALPAGLVFNTTTGVISGTPTVVSATTSYTVTVSNGVAPSGTVVFTISVQTPPVISYVTPQNYTTGSAITPLVPSVYGGGTGWTISPALPAGLTINTTTGVISGTPTAVNAATAYTVQASNQYGTGSTVVTISTGNAPSGLSYILPGSSLLLNNPIQGILPVLSSGTGPFTFTISPALPAGLTINPVTGVITGTPTAATAPTTYTITVTNPYGTTSTTINFATGTVPSNLSYTTPNTFVAGTAITALNPTITTGPGAITYTISPALPNGLSINASTGIISGTPVTGVSSPATNYTVTATNAFGSTTAQLSIAVSGPPVGLSYGNLTFVVNAPVVTVLPTVSASPAVTLYTISGTLPAGLSFNPATGAITGTPVGGASTGTYTVTASNGIGPNATTTFTITVQVMPTVSYVTPQNYVVGTAITPLTPTTQGAPNAWVISPALPAGLSINAATGVISGTPTVVSAATAYTITATNNSGSASAVVTIATGNAPSGLTYAIPVNVPVNTPIASILPSLGIGTGPFTYSGTPLPPGLVFNPTTGAITGTPTTISAGGTYNIVVTSPFGSTSVSFTLSTGVAPSGLSYPTPKVYDAGNAITPLAPTILIGSTAPTYSVSPALPSGLTLNASTGEISGTPTAGISVAATNYTVTASNPYGAVTAVVNITINALPTAFTYPTPKVYTVGSPIGQLLPTIVGGTFTSFTVSPALPAGLVLNTTTGIITGTPTTITPIATYTITGTNTSGSLSTTLQITVNDAPPTAFTYNPSTVSVQNGVTVVKATPVIGGGAVTLYTISPALPPGMTFNPATGVISGVPNVAPGTTITYTITASNSGGSVSTTFTLVVTGAALPTPQNILTPNGDGVNDKWTIAGIAAYPNAEIYIYDKAGRTVYRKTGGYNNDWDGKVNGNVLKNDTYFYMIMLNKPGVDPLIRGYITIIR